MTTKKTEIIKLPSMVPFYIVIAIAIVCMVLLPMYKITSWFITGIISAISYIILQKLHLFKEEEMEVEVLVEYKTSEIEELVKLGEKQIAQLKEENKTIDKVSVHEDINSIIETSERIITHINETQDIERDIRKYFRYYLDEIVKLVTYYDEFEERSEHSDNLHVSKEKIEATLGNAKKAFQTFYDNLYAGKAMDISVDTKVFESMLKQLQ